jgi:WW domain
MAGKRKRSSKQEEEDGEVAPPLSDEPLPVSEQQPPLPDESPPLPDEEPPPLPDEESPPLPDEDLPVEPPVPDEPLPSMSEDSDQVSIPNKSVSIVSAEQINPEPDAWQAIWEPSANAYYFYNAETRETTWLNPRLPRDQAEAYLAAHPPLIDPSAPSVLLSEPVPEDVYDPETGEYAFTAHFNARTGKFQNNPEHTAENFSTQGQLMRTAREYFDVSQMSEGKIVGKSGGSLKAERKSMKIPKSQLKELIRRRKEKKDRNKREWLRNDDIIVRKH